MMRLRVPADLTDRMLRGPVLWSGLAALTAFALGPFIWMLLTSLKSREELYATPLQYLPQHPTLENYVDAWTSPVMPSRASALPGAMHCCSSFLPPRCFRAFC